MGRRRAVRLAIAAIVLLGCFYIGRGLFWLPAVPSYRGDGTFQDLSHRAGPFAIRGYCISMPEFDLAEPYQAEYRLAQLANIGRKCGVHLAIRDHDDRWWGDTRFFGGEVRLELFDSRGRSVVTVSGRLGDYIWWGFSDLHVLYQLDKSYFIPDRGEQYRLRVSYEPDPMLAGYKGFVYVRSGGTK
jgi:hypothetical protein